MNKVYWMQAEGESSWFVSFLEKDIELLVFNHAERRLIKQRDRSLHRL